MTKPRIDPIRWQPPPSRPLPEPDLTATLHVVPLPGNAPEDVVAMPRAAWSHSTPTTATS
jgi:hypothetical protein